MSKVLQGQSFVDKTLELTGSVEALVSMAFANDCSMTTDVTINDEVLGSGVLKPNVVAGFIYRKPATNVLIESVVEKNEGIDYWGIEIDFEVK